MLLTYELLIDRSHYGANRFLFGDWHREPFTMADNVIDLGEFTDLLLVVVFVHTETPALLFHMTI